MKRPKLEVIKRELLGKKIKKLRKEGILPANIYGEDIEPGLFYRLCFK